MNHAVEAIRLFKLLNRDQRNTFVACFLGWTLDAFDFFLLTFVIVPMAHDFGTSVADLTYAIAITLAMRPVGALRDRHGRRMGVGRVAGNGNIANSGARIVLGNFAARLRVRLSPGGGCLLDRVSALRLARSLCRRCAPSVPCALHSYACA